MSASLSPPSDATSSVDATAARRVLLVDDEENLVRLARRLIVQLGYQVSAFTKPADALAEFARDPSRFDLLCTDLNMPVMSGIELARATRLHRPDMPVVLVSGEGVDLPPELGGTPWTFLEKPYNRRTLSAALAAALAAR